MDKNLLGVIIGGAIGGGVGIITALITNWHGAKQQIKMLKHDSEENTKRYLREIGKERIQAYKVILMNIESAHVDTLNAIENIKNNDKEKIVTVWKKFMSECVPQLILVSEEIEKKLASMMVDILLIAKKPGMRLEKYKEINNTLVNAERPLIVAIRSEIESIELSFGKKK